MRLASSGVGGVRRVRLALLYVGSCIGVLWMMLYIQLHSTFVLYIIHHEHQLNNFLFFFIFYS